jgi:hypothetical protein
MESTGGCNARLSWCALPCRIGRTRLMNLRLNTLAGWCTLAASFGLLAVVGCGTTTNPTPTPITDTVQTDVKGDAVKTDAADASTDTGGDAVDNAACCKKAKAVCGFVSGCPGTCGGCTSGKTCDTTLHQCVVPVTLKKFGEACGPSADCPAPDPRSDQATYDEAQKTYLDCVAAECDSGVCDFGLTYTGAGYCGQSCVMGADVKNNATGAKGGDGVEDDAAGSECVGAVDGPAGTAFRCVSAAAPGQSGSSSCKPGDTFKACQADSDCGAKEACGLLQIAGKFASVCTTRYKNTDATPPGKSGEICGNGYSLFANATCGNNFCRGATCASFCKVDSDCAPSQKCAADQSIFSNVPDKFSMCAPKDCVTDKDCGATGYCETTYNDVKSAGGDPDPKDKTKLILPGFKGQCGLKTKGAKAGEACDPNLYNDPKDSAGLCEAWGMCIAGGCSSLCVKDTDCVAGQKCGAFLNIQNVGTSAAPDYTSPVFTACINLPGATTSCVNDAQCSGGQICRFWTYYVELPFSGTPTGASNQVLTGGGICVTPGAKDVPPGGLCGSDAPTDAQCANAVCHNQLLGWQNTETKAPLNIGACLPLCNSQSDCAAGLDLVTSTDGKTTHYNAFCRTDIGEYSPNDPYDPAGRVWRPVCWPFSTTAKPVDCSATKTCSSNKEACFPIPIMTGPDKGAKVDYLCLTVVGDTDPAPTKKVGEVCNADPNSTAPETCMSGQCSSDIAKNVGYCSALCASDTDCGNGTVCDLNHQWYPRNDASKAAIVPICVKKKACMPCDYDRACHSDMRCTHNAAGKLGGCAYQCSTDDDCKSQGGGTCGLAKDRFGKDVPGVKVCAPGCK